MKISYRLIRVAQTVTPGYRVADIGTDHGYVPIYLIKNGLAEHVIAMDINAGPLERARENITQNGLEEEIEVRLSDGFEKLEKNEAEIACISGLGGELMKNILFRGSDVVNKLNELVLSPHSEIPEVRAYVHRIEHRIINEEMVKDDGKYYTIIKTHSGKEEQYSALEYKYGKLLLERKEEVFKGFLEQKRQKDYLILENLKNGDNIASALRYEQIKSEVAEIEKILL